MRLSLRRAQVESDFGPGLKPEAVHLLTEYVLNMSLSAAGDNDVTPLYELYMLDSRLGDFERGELMWVYMSLRLRPTPLLEGS